MPDLYGAGGRWRQQARPRPVTRAEAGALQNGARAMTAVREPEGEPVLRLHLLGAFCLRDGQHRTIAIRTRKAQAMLALLALSPRGARSRVWLRDKLWSGSDEKRSSTCLRQTLFELRRDLGPLADRALRVSVHEIALDLQKVWIDHRAVAADPGAFHRFGLCAETELLEGFDIADPEFEDWLMLERSAWADRAEELADAPAPPLAAASATPGDRSAVLGHDGAVTAMPAPEPAASIAILRSVLHGGDALCVPLADRVMEGIATGLCELSRVDVLDLRERATEVETLVKSARTEFYCRLRLLRVGENVTLTLLVHRASRMALEWSQSIQCRMDELVAYDGVMLQGFVAQCVDRLAQTLLPQGRDAEPAGSARRSGYAALNLIFRLDPNALESARRLLLPEDDAHDPLHEALRAYLASFSVGENLGTLTESDRAEIYRMGTARLRASPFNSVALACFGHVLGYVFQEHAAAGELLERAVRLNPAQAFAWDHYALHKLYAGDARAGRAAAERAVALGAYSPIAYSYETTLTMAATLEGDYDRALQAGRRALQKQPKFNATKRYLMIAHTARGDRAEAEALRDGLLDADPDIRHPDIREARFGRGILHGNTALMAHLDRLFD
ncbi:tetratricopeptide repeat protein [Pararhodobacter sp. SW119]|uniref:tetratricopeptide repeat protein n=1 Tax=Pararhodobacter sp. SW119 TaxID=2780075 RepID=UPI001ADFFFA1|nr:tetratricopeptide repeat protein [Pararhodobacter sp. SW119]